MGSPLRFAICNEVYEKSSLDSACKDIRKLGYEGIELAPFTLSSSPETLTQADRAGIRNTILKHGLEFVGLHWLLVSPRSLQAVSADKELRNATWRYIDSLIDLCGDLKAREEAPGVMVFGSPKQRSTNGEMTPEQAVEIFTEELGRVAPHAERRNVKILVESLSHDQTDVINTLEEAVMIVDRISSPAVRTMFDSHNASDETAPHPELVRKYFPYLEHIHVNEMDGREPGTGNYDFAALLQTLVALNYKNWVSLEVFDFSRDSNEIAARALHHLRNAAEVPVSS
jgi:D-psicose/D-tagatose/L-ribulose 3-epimerase